MIADKIKRELAACNGGPGLTTAELVDRLGVDLASVQSTLAALIFVEHSVTTVAVPGGKASEARHALGDPRRPLVEGNPTTAVVIA